MALVPRSLVPVKAKFFFKCCGPHSTSVQTRVRQGDDDIQSATDSATSVISRAQSL